MNMSGTLKTSTYADFIERDLGELTIMPANGELKINAGTQNNHMKGYSSLYSKDKEKVSPSLLLPFLQWK